MIATPDSHEAIALIEEAVHAGARRHRACIELGLTLRALERWRQGDAVKSDGRPGASRPLSRNRLSEAERTQVLKVVNKPRFASLPPTQIVPRLADEGQYLASESTVYRLLRDRDQLKHRGRARASQTRTIPRQCAKVPNELWSSDISYLPGPVQGMFYFFYLFDVYSRKIVAPRGACGGIRRTGRSPHRAGLRARAHRDPAHPAPRQRQPHEGLDLRREARWARDPSFLQPSGSE